MGDKNSKYKEIKTKSKGKKKGKIPVYKQTSTNKDEGLKLSDYDMNILSSEGKKFNEEYLNSPKYKERMAKEYKRESARVGSPSGYNWSDNADSNWVLENKHKREGKEPPTYFETMKYNLANKYNIAKKIGSSWLDNQSDYDSRADKMIEKRKKNLSSVAKPTYNYSEGSLGSYNQWDKTINFNPYSATPETADHEYSHASTNANTDIVTNTAVEIRELANKNPKKEGRNLNYIPQMYDANESDTPKISEAKKQLTDIKNKELDEYFTEPTEVKARLDVSRKLLKWGSDNKKGTNNPFTKDATDEDIKYLQESGEQNVKDLFNHYTPEQVKWMLNNIAHKEGKAPKSKYKKVNAKKRVT